MQNAAQNGENDTIILADGIYKTTDDGNGRFEYLDNEVYDLTLIGSSRENVILSGDEENNIFRHQSIDGADLKIEKISFIDGGPVLGEYGNRMLDGGAIYVDRAAIDIVDCNFTNNYASQGGALYTAVNTGDINISNTTFTNNTALSGGGFYTASTIQKIIVHNSNFTNNSSVNGAGGGFHITAQSTAVVSDSNFTNNTAFSSGGGFYCQVAEVSNSDFIENNVAREGGGFAATRMAQVLNSNFDKNIAGEGGGFFSYDATVINSTFTDNNATDPTFRGGGGFSTSYGHAIVSRSIFSQNYSKNNGGGFVALGGIESVVTNSIFTNNIADGVVGGLSVAHLFMSNSMITNNSDGAYLSGASSATNPNIIKNSIFIDNYITDVSADPQSDISGVDGAVASINNNYIDNDNVHVQSLKSNNIFTDATLGFEDVASGDYRLTASSDLIDTGTNDFADKFIVGDVNYLERDLDENNRSVGSNMDIGIYEYSTTKPTINSFTFSTDPKTLQEVIFNVDYTLSDGRSIHEVSFDYLNDGAFSTEETYIFSEAKTYTVTVKITDDAGEFSLRIIEVLVAALPYDEMTNDQRLIIATNPLHYEDILSIIAQEKVAAEDEGRKYVQDNLEEFGFINKSTIEFTVASLATLPTGWSLVGMSLDMTDLSAFDDATIVWSYDNSTSSWSAYSSDEDMKIKIKNELNVNELNKISVGSAIWIQK